MTPGDSHLTGTLDERHAGRRSRLLVLLSNILGIRQISAYLRRELEPMSDQWDMEFVVFDTEHFRSHRRFRPWNLWKGAFEAAYCARALIAEADPDSFDAYLVTGPELMHALAPWSLGKPFLVYADSTDRLSHAQVAAVDPSRFADVKRRIKDLLTGLIYRPLWGRRVVALAESEWCAESMKRDYGLLPTSVWIVTGVMDLEKWCPPPVKRPLAGRKARLLFVGNDFERKGGAFLLEVLAGLGESCELTVVSKDPAAAVAASTCGITVLGGLNHDDLAPIVRLYQEADLLVLPTWIDKLPNVAREACATGLPIVARDCGAMSEVVYDGINGRLLPFRSTPLDWIAAIRALLADESKWREMGLASRQIAEAKLSRSILSNNLREALLKVRALCS